ncbi:hypothetical protein HJC23_005477, partial [Cyclotella cryptica]
VVCVHKKSHLGSRISDLGSQCFEIRHHLEREILVSRSRILDREPSLNNTPPHLRVFFPTSQETIVTVVDIDTAGPIVTSFHRTVDRQQNEASEIPTKAEPRTSHNRTKKRYGDLWHSGGSRCHDECPFEKGQVDRAGEESSQLRHAEREGEHS